MTSFLAFLFPLAVYFFVLGLINRRRHPLLVPGPWDFAGLLFAASGFLLFGGPGILSGLRRSWQISWLLDPRRSEEGLAGGGYYLWVFLSVLYFVVVVGGSALLLWRRRNQLSVYNVEPRVFDECLAHALDRLGLPWSRSGPHFLIGPAGKRPKSAVELMVQGVRVEVDASPSLRHVTVYWDQVDPPLRQEIESELGQVLARVTTRSNPASVWFLLTASLLFGLIIFLALVAVIIPGVVGG